MEQKSRLHELKKELVNIENHRMKILLELDTYFNPEGTRMYRNSAIIHGTVKFLKEVGRPVTIAELVHELRKRNVQFPPHHPHRYIAGVFAREIRRKIPRIARVAYGKDSLQTK